MHIRRTIRDQNQPHTILNRRRHDTVSTQVRYTCFNSIHLYIGLIETAFEILSIDIADIDVGENIGAKLQADQAEADKRRFQAQAEQRRAMAVAQEQEFRAEEQKNQALVVLAEAEVPKAMAEAFRTGNMGIMDYYRMKNIQSDTSMRSAIAGEDGAPKGPTVS